MTLAKFLVVVLPLAVAAGWFALHHWGPAAAFGHQASPHVQASVEDIRSPENAIAGITAAAPSFVDREAITPPEDPDPSTSAAKVFPVEGRVVRAMDGAPLGGLKLNLIAYETPFRGWNSKQYDEVSVTTNEDGSFVVPSLTWTERHVRISVQDGSNYVSTVAETYPFPFAGNIEIGCGPTFELLYGGVYVDPRSPSKATLPTAAEDQATDTREGTNPWVRFSRRLSRDTDEIRVEADGDFLFARGRIDDPSGADQGPIDLEFEEGGAVEFRYFQDSPAPIMQLTMSSLDRPSSPPRSLELRKYQGGAEELARATHLSIGSYRWDLKFGSTQLGGEIGVKPGEWTRVTVGAELAAPLTAMVEIDITGAPGIDWERWGMSASFEEDPTQKTGEVFKPEATEDPNRWIVRVDGLSEGRWQLILAGPPGFEVSPAVVPLAPGGAPSKVTVVRSAPPSPIRIRVVDAATGEPVPGAAVFHMDGMFYAPVEANDQSLGKFGPHGVPSDRSSSFLVSAEGYKLTEKTFDPRMSPKLAPAADRTRAVIGSTDGAALEIRLERGWRTRFFAVDITSQAMAPGVSIHVDGEHVGETDDDGCFWLTRPEPPKEVLAGLLNAELVVLMDGFEAAKDRPRPWDVGFQIVVRPR